MNGQAKTVLWIGIILITVQLVSSWGTIKTSIFSKGPGSTGGGNTSANNLLLPGLPSTLQPFGPLSIPGIIKDLGTQKTPANVNVGSKFPLIGP